MSLSQRLLIPVDGSGRILITDIGHDESNSLTCSSWNLGAEGGNWYLHPTKKSTADRYKIIFSGAPEHGWYSNGNSAEVFLWRDSVTTAKEGVFTCKILGGDSGPVSVGIYYNSESITTEIASNQMQFHTYKYSRDLLTFIFVPNIKCFL